MHAIAPERCAPHGGARLRATLRLVPAVLLAALSCVATPAAADDKNYALVFDPIALNLEVGQVGTFTLNYTRNGEGRASTPQDYKVIVRPPGGATLRIEGGGFAFVAIRAGVYEIYAEHDSGRSWYGARGSMFVRVSEPARRGVAAIAVARTSDRAAVGGNVALPLHAGHAERVYAVALDAERRPLADVELPWATDSPKLRLTRVGPNQYDVTALAAPAPGERIAFTVGGADPPGVVVQVQVVAAPVPDPPAPGAFPAILLRTADTGELIDPAGELDLAPGQAINLRGEYVNAAGRPERVVLSWTLEPAAIGRVVVGPGNAAAVVIAHGTDGRHAKLVVAVPGTALRREQVIHIEAGGHAPPPRGAVRIVVAHGASGEPVGEGPLVLAPGQRLALVATGYDAGGTALARWVPRWELGREAGALEIDGARVVVAAGATPGRFTLSAVCAASGVRADVPIEVRAAEVPMPGPGRLARLAIVDAATGQPLAGEQVFRPGVKLTLRAVGLDRRGQPVATPDVAWTISSLRGGKLWLIDPLTVRLDVALAASDEVHEIVARIDDRLVDRLRFRVGDVAVPVPPAPVLARVAVVAQLGDGWVALDVAKPLFVPRGATVTLRVVGYDKAGGELRITGRWESPAATLEVLDPATVRVARLPPGSGALVLVHVPGVAEPVSLWVLMP